jgi:uncharacterized protein (TIGR00369 family)
MQMIDGSREMADRAASGGKHEFGSFFLSRLLGFEIDYSDDRCRVRFEATPQLTNPMGTLHGGVIATALDVSMGHLLYYSLGGPGATIEMKVQYVSPMTEGRVVCEASFIHTGKSIAFLKSEASDADTGRIIAYATATWKPPRDATSKGGSR